MTDFDPIFDRANVYEDDAGQIVYRASSFGYCLGALVRARLGMTPAPPPDLMLERYQEGHDWEREVLAAGLGVDWLEVTTPSALKRFGQIVEGRNGERQVEAELRWSNKILRVHPDAIVQRAATGEMRVCEVKFLAGARVSEMAQADAKADSEGMRAVLGDQYAWQASIEMLVTGLPMLYVVGEKQVKVTADSREVVGIGNVLVMEWSEPAFTFRDVKMRVAEVEGWASRGEFPACPVPFDWPCGWYQDHEVREAEEITDTHLAALVEDYERCKIRQDGVATALEGIRADISTHLASLGLTSGRCKGWDIATIEPRPGNISWSKWAAKVKKDHPEVKVDEDQFRGAEVAGGVRMTRVKP